MDRLLQQLTTESAEMLVETLRQIARQDECHGIAVRVVELAGHRCDEVRMWANEALEGVILPDPADTMTLSTYLSSDDGEICYWAATMLGRLGSDAGAAVTALQECVQTSLFLPARERAVWALSQIGPQAAAALPALMETAADGPPRLKRLAAEAANKIQRTAA